MSGVRTYSSLGPDSRRAVIWLVDDSALQGEIARLALADVYDVHVFSQGDALLERLSLGSAPELLVVDWHMPGLSGLEICRFVRQTRDAATLPILILTATGGDDLSDAFAAGANDFVHKPFSRTELLARAGGLVRTRDIHVKLTEAEGRLRIEGEFRERFIAMLAHDLRQPLNAFVLANAMLSKGLSAWAPAAAILAVQSRAASRMARMVDQLLDFARSRPETGMPVAPQVMDLEVLVREIVDEMGVGHPQRSFRVQLEGQRCSGFWDRDRLAQIISNLIGNAIEHGSSPSSPIEVRLLGRRDDVELIVSNEGQPIPANLLSGLFEPFRRTKKSTGKGGLGLGLHIVDQIARAHGGTTAVQSDASATVFRVTLPLGASPPLAQLA